VNLLPLAAGRARITDGLGEEFAAPVQRIAAELEQAGAKAFNSILYEGDTAPDDLSGPTETPTIPNENIEAVNVAVPSLTPTFAPTNTHTVRPTNTEKPTSTPTRTQPAPSSTPAPDGNYYVAAIGSDANPGTLEEP
jgi:hypothetical protein